MDEGTRSQCFKPEATLNPSGDVVGVVDGADKVHRTARASYNVCLGRDYREEAG